MIGRLRQMLIKEFIQILRDPRMRAVIFLVPVFQLLLFGYAVRTDVKDISLAILDRDRSPQSRSLIEGFTGSGYFEPVAYLDGDHQVDEMLDSGTARAVLCLPADFQEKVLSGQTVAVQMIFDATDSLTASVVLNYSQAIAQRYSVDALTSRMARSGLKLSGGVVDIETRAWFNETLESRNFFIPGVFGLLVTLITLMLTSMAIVREKEIGTMEQIMVSPIRPVEFILGKTLPFALIGLIDVAIVVTVGVLWFDIPVRGSLALLFLAMGLYVLTTLGVGLLISTISSTQQQAMMTTFFFFMPAMLLSGFAFPIENMPLGIRLVTYANPMRYLFEILRGIFLKGVGMQVLWPQMGALGVIGVATLFLASLRFRKTLN